MEAVAQEDYYGHHQVETMRGPKELLKPQRGLYKRKVKGEMTDLQFAVGQLTKYYTFNYSENPLELGHVNRSLLFKLGSTNVAREINLCRDAKAYR